MKVIKTAIDGTGVRLLKVANILFLLCNQQKVMQNLLFQSKS